MFAKNVNIYKFHYHIWNRHKKCIQISTNKPGIALVICEISLFKFYKKQTILHGQANDRVLNVKHFDQTHGDIETNI